jgi:hypothetical protein
MDEYSPSSIRGWYNHQAGAKLSCGSLPAAVLDTRMLSRWLSRQVLRRLQAEGALALCPCNVRADLPRSMQGLGRWCWPAVHWPH